MHKIKLMETDTIIIYTLKRDGEKILMTDDYYSIVYWIHQNTSHSLDWACKYEGYSVEEEVRA